MRHDRSRRIAQPAVIVLVSCLVGHTVLSAQPFGQAPSPASHSDSRGGWPTFERSIASDRFQREQGAIPAASPGPTTLGKKREGVKRIGVLTPIVDFQSSSTSQLAAAQVLAIVVSYLQAPTLEVVPLTAKVPAAAALEAKTSECDDVLTINVARAPGKSKANALAKRWGFGGMPGLTMNASALMAVQAGASTASAAAWLASLTQEDDTVTFTYTLSNAASNAAFATDKRSAKAKETGEDLITPLVSAMANAIVPELLKAGQ
jgi:hypothetical protein